MTGFLAGLAGLRRGPWEMVASILIALGVFMMMQPWVFAALHLVLRRDADRHGRCS